MCEDCHDKLHENTNGHIKVTTSEGPILKKCMLIIYMKSVKLIASIFAICAAYILLKLIFGEQINDGGNKYVHEFFKEYGDEVALVVLLFLLILTLADAYDWNFNPPTHKHLEKIVLVEGMSGMRRHHSHKHHHHKHNHDDDTDHDTDDDTDDEDNKKEALENGFCKYHKGKAHDLEKHVIVFHTIIV